MAKEIERKWLFNYDKYNIYEFVKGMSYYDIKDHYFNEFCRLRNLSGGVWFITIKSKGNLIRDEFEFLIDNEDMDFIPVLVLAKTRYIENIEEEYPFEINIFRDVLITFKGEARPLIIVEKEFDNPYIIGDDHIPDFCGKEITNDQSYYGYNLFNIVKEGTNSSFKAQDDSKVIYLKDYLDKHE